VTEEMIHEWMKTYEDEFDGSQTPLLLKLKILSETERKIETYKKIGMRFFKDFFQINIKSLIKTPSPFPSPQRGEGGVRGKR
jgi:hypothetical protein